MRKTLNSSIAILGKVVTQVEITNLIEEDSVLVCSLLNENSEVIYESAAFVYKGEGKTLPFNYLNEGEMEYLQGKPPRKGWLKTLTQRWMSERQTKKDEDGNTLNTDPLYFITKDTEDQLLSKIDAFLNPEVG